MAEFDPNQDGMEMDERNENESTVDGTTGAVGETDFGGGEIEVPRLRRRGSIPEAANISIDDRNSLEGLTQRLKNLRSGDEEIGDSQETAIRAVERQRSDVATRMFYDYAEKSGYEVNDRSALTKEANIQVDDSGRIFAEYRGKKTWLMKENMINFFSLNSIASQIKGVNPGGTEFIRVGLGLKNFDRKSTPQTQEKVERAESSVNKVLSTPRGRPYTQRVFDFLQTTNDDMAGLASELPEDPFVNQEEIRNFLDAKGRLKRLSDVYNHLVERRDEKADKLTALKSKSGRAVSFVNPTYEGEEGEPLLPVSEEDAEKARELEAEIKEFDDAIADQDSKVRNQLQRVKQSLTNFMEGEKPLVERVQTLFREQGVTIASLITAIGMAIATIVEGILLATRSVASAVTPKPDPAPKPKPKPKPDPKPKPKPEPGVKGWIQKIANLLSKLGDKALIALPAILGAVVNFVLKSVSSVVGFIAEHTWLLIVGVGYILYDYVKSLK